MTIGEGSKQTTGSFISYEIKKKNIKKAAKISTFLTMSCRSNSSNLSSSSIILAYLEPSGSAAMNAKAYSQHSGVGFNKTLCDSGVEGVDKRSD
jgi:hypothetical protein